MRHFEIFISKEDTGEKEDLVFQITFPSMKVRWFGYNLEYGEWKNMIKYTKNLKSETIQLIDEMLIPMSRDINIEMLLDGNGN